MRAIANLLLLLMLLTVCCWLMPGHQDVEFDDYGLAQPRRGVAQAFQDCLVAFSELLVAVADLHTETTRPMELAPEPVRAGFGATLLAAAVLIFLGLIGLIGLLRALNRLL